MWRFDYLDFGQDLLNWSAFWSPSSLSEVIGLENGEIFYREKQHDSVRIFP